MFNGDTFDTGHLPLLLATAGLLIVYLATRQMLRESEAAAGSPGPLVSATEIPR